MLCDGSEIDSTAYPELYNLIKGGSFEQSTSEAASSFTIGDSLDSYNYIYYSGVVNGVYCIVINKNLNTYLAYSMDPESEFNIKSFSNFKCQNINYCNGYYVMVGNNENIPSTSTSGKQNQKVIIKYTDNIFTAEFSTKEITGVQGTSYYWWCVNTNMVYGNGKYYVVCNLHYNTYNISDTIGHLSSDTIDGDYVATKTEDSNYTSYTGTSGAYFDETSKLFFVNLLYTRSGYQSTRGIVAYSNLFVSSVSAISETSTYVNTIYCPEGLFAKLDENIFVCTNIGSSGGLCIFSVDATNNALKKMTKPGTIVIPNNAYVPITKNITATSKQGGQLYCNVSFNVAELGYIKNDYSGTNTMYNIVNAKDVSRFLFFSKDCTKMYYAPSSGSTSTIQVKFVEMKNYLPTITNDNYNTFIRALE